MGDAQQGLNTTTDRAVGSARTRLEDARLLAGRGRYVGDVVLPRMLHATFVRSAHAHAAVAAVDTTAARKLPGVDAVLTAVDLPPVTLSSSRHPDLLLTPQPVLAGDRVRFVGEALAIVLADSRYVAEDAAELVDVEYRELDVAQHGRPGTVTTPLFEHIPDNVVFRDQQTYGDVEGAFEAATTVVSTVYRHARQVACPLEGRGCVADYDPSSGQLTVWASTQAPHRLQRDLAAAVLLPENHIRVVMHDIGGGFGQKIPTHLEEVAVVLASMATGRPVKWVEDRQENLVAAPHSRDQTIRLDLALDADLRFLGLRARLLGDAGAYSFNSASCLTEAYRAARSLPGVYRIEHYSYDVRIELSNKSPIAPYRGVGLVAAQTARELLIDKAARQLGMDRIELRRRNMVSADELPYTTCTGWVFQDVSFQETLTAACELLDAPDSWPDLAPDLILGVGVSPFVEPSGLGGGGGLQLHGFPSPSHDSARVRVDTSGKVVVSCGTPSMGQGLETSLAQVAADVLGLPLSDVSVRWTDTTQAPVSLTGSRGSRAAVVSGGGVGLAATEVRAQILDVAGKILEADAADLQIRNGEVFVVGESSPRLSVADVVKAGFTREELRTPGSERTFEATRLYDPPASYSNATVIAVVGLDPELGSVTVLRVIGVEDCGVMINPMIVEGQFIGAVAQAIGAALLERVEYNLDGQPVTSTLVDYLLPTAADTVRVEMSHIVTPSSVTWGGFKGMGESGLIGTVAALATAVADAVAAVGGGEVDELPLLPERVWQLLHRPAEATR